MYYDLSGILSNKELLKEHMFDMIDLRLNPRVLPHVDVLMAVRFLRRVDSSDYIETLRGILWKGGKSLCLLLLTLSRCLRCVQHFMVLDMCMGSTIPRQKNNRPCLVNKAVIF